MPASSKRSDRGLPCRPTRFPQPERLERLPDVDPGIADALKLLLKLVADEAGVAPRLIANAADLDKLAALKTPDLPALHGWRREVFGAAALDLKAGKLALKIEGGRLVATGA